MGLNAKKILGLGAEVALAVGTGGISLATVPAMMSLAAEFIPGEDPDVVAKKEKLDDWERDMIRDWVSKYRQLMDIPMKPDIKTRTMKDRLRSDFILSYADMPEEKWVDGVYEMIETAVRGALASGGEV